MATHMSIRLAWHSDGWNGHICKKPCENSYCIGQHSYPGDLIAGTRDLDFETAHAGEACSEWPCGVACGFSVNAFGNESITVRVDPPSFWKKNDADPVRLTLPPATACTWCYEQMYNEEVEKRQLSEPSWIISSACMVQEQVSYLWRLLVRQQSVLKHRQENHRQQSIRIWLGAAGSMITLL